MDGVRIRAELDGEPVDGVQIRLNDRRVGTTDSEGALAATYPLAAGADVVAQGYGQTVRTGAGSPLLGPALLLGLLGLGFGYGRRRGLSPRGLVDGTGGLVVRLCRRAVAAVVAVASRVDAAISRLLAALSRLRADVRALPEMLRAWLRAVHDRLRAFARRLRAIFDRLRRRLVAAGEWLAALRHEDPRTLARALYAWLLARLRDERVAGSDRDEGGAARRGAAAVAGDAESDDARLTIREAWREFLGYASVSRWQTMTPGEVAARTVERDGLPADAVTTLRDAFRDVEYGQRSPDERLDGAREALDRIRHAAENPTEASD
ncbi:DUF4129 domain-containing protein [Haloplanus sp. GCM10025708]|uniref:DUF4129 domain-containing protein n=1 Tax=Haloplanus sp. GCM10025708 TaxID=3252679 RepID=UPI00360C84A4